LPASNNTIKQLLLNESKRIQGHLASELRQFKGSVVLTIDIWTDPIMLHSYVGITAHFIHGSKLIFCCIGVEDLIGRHNAENIKECVEKKLAIYGLQLNDIFSIVTDNGSNVIKAFDNYQCKIFQYNS